MRVDSSSLSFSLSPPGHPTASRGQQRPLTLRGEIRFDRRAGRRFHVPTRVRQLPLPFDGVGGFDVHDIHFAPPPPAGPAIPAIPACHACPHARDQDPQPAETATVFVFPFFFSLSLGFMAPIVSWSPRRSEWTIEFGILLAGQVIRQLRHPIPSSSSSSTGAPRGVWPWKTKLHRVCPPPCSWPAYGLPAKAAGYSWVSRLSARLGTDAY